MRHALNPGGAIVIGTFAEDGPTQCSNLEVRRYSQVEVVDCWERPSSRFKSSGSCTRHPMGQHSRSTGWLVERGLSPTQRRRGAHSWRSGTPLLNRQIDQTAVMSISIRDAEIADMDELQGVFQRASLSNENDRGPLLEHPEWLMLSDRGVREGRIESRRGRR